MLLCMLGSKCGWFSPELKTYMYVVGDDSDAAAADIDDDDGDDDDNQTVTK